jgi:hypothetical protein
MKKRGKILRDTSGGAGLLMIEGQQFPFTLEGMWRSEQAPRTGMTVEAQFEPDGTIAGLNPVSDAQLAREQSEVALAAARAKGGELASGLVARLGVPTLAALALLAAAWFGLNTVVVNVGPQFSLGLSFWKLLGVLNSPMGVMSGLNGAGAGAGLYGLFAMLALAAPAAPHVWGDRRAHLGALMPLAFMLLVAFLFYNGIGNAVGDARGAAASFGGAEAASMVAGMQQSMLREAMRAVSLGVGFYLACAASLYFAVTGAIKYLAARAA